MNHASWKWPIAIGVLLGLPAAAVVRYCIDEPQQYEPQQYVVAIAEPRSVSVDEIVAQHLNWAAEQGDQGVISELMPISEFFTAARGRTRAFAEEALGWQSKYLAVRDNLLGEEQHGPFMEARFSELVFAPEDLEQLVQATVASYLRRLGDVDAEVLVRLQADLEDVPAESLAVNVDRQAIQESLSVALANAIRSMEMDLGGNVGRELVSFVAGEVLSMAATELATSAGILGVGAVSGTVTFGIGLVVGIIVDYIVSWAYDKLYDPAGEISRNLNDTLCDLEKLIVGGSEDSPGLAGQLLDIAVQRSKARAIAIQTVVTR